MMSNSVTLIDDTINFWENFIPLLRANLRLGFTNWHKCSQISQRDADINFICLTLWEKKTTFWRDQNTMIKSMQYIDPIQQR